VYILLKLGFSIPDENAVTQIPIANPQKPLQPKSSGAPGFKPSSVALQPLGPEAQAT